MRRALLPLLLSLAAVSLHAQALEIRGGEGTAARQLAEEITGRGRFLLIDRDTVLPPTFHARSDVVVLGAEVRLEGRIDGDVAVLGGHLFLRPRSNVAGRVAVLGGGVYPSALGTHGEILDPAVQPEVREVAAGTGRAVRVADPPSQPRVTLPGIFGVLPPAYDRVNGVTTGVQAQLRLAPRAENAALLGFATYRTGLERPGGGAQLRIRVGDNLRLTARASRETHTNEAWIRGTLANTLAALAVGSDVRNYYGSDRLALIVDRPDVLVPRVGEWLWSPRFGALLSDDRSFPQTTEWALFGTGSLGLERPNPPVDEGMLASALAGSAFAWQGRTSALDGEMDVELAPGLGDFAFAQLRASAAYQMAALRTHRILLGARVLVPVGGEGAPQQRWSGLGGAGTLPTYRTLVYRGDHLAFVNARYGIPLPQLQIPLLGAPELQLRYATGAAWPSSSDMPRWGQNLGATLRFLPAALELWIDPASDDLDLTVSASIGLGDG